MEPRRSVRKRYFWSEVVSMVWMMVLEIWGSFLWGARSLEGLGKGSPWGLRWRWKSGLGIGTSRWSVLRCRRKFSGLLECRLGSSGLRRIRRPRRTKCPGLGNVFGYDFAGRVFCGSRPRCIVRLPLFWPRARLGSCRMLFREVGVYVGPFLRPGVWAARWKVTWSRIECLEFVIQAQGSWDLGQPGSYSSLKFQALCCGVLVCTEWLRFFVLPFWSPSYRRGLIFAGSFSWPSWWNFPLATFWCSSSRIPSHESNVSALISQLPGLAQ